MSNLLGQTIGHYRLTDHIGRGGMADVYKAIHIELNVVRAIKVVRPEYADSDDFRTRFLREAQAMASLEHPNIVRVYDFGVHEDQYYIVLQFVAGETLSQRLLSGGALDPEAAVPLICRVASALDVAHKLDLVHRDVKPDNIMLNENGEPILMDFGIAKLLSATALTQTGAGIGTPAYMAPEQAQGDNITASVDLYALCVVLFELITAAQPFRADTPIASMMKVINEPLPSPRSLVPGLSVAIENTIAKGTAKNPLDRHHDAAELISELNGGASAGAMKIMDATVKVPKRGKSTSPFFKPTKTELLIIALGMFGTVVLVVLGLIYEVFD